MSTPSGGVISKALFGFLNPDQDAQNIGKLTFAVKTHNNAFRISSVLSWSRVTVRCQYTITNLKEFVPYTTNFFSFQSIVTGDVDSDLTDIINNDVIGSTDPVLVWVDGIKINIPL